MARMPVAALSIGPTVPPERESLRIWKICRVEEERAAMRVRRVVVRASVGAGLAVGRGLMGRGGRRRVWENNKGRKGKRAG